MKGKQLEHKTLNLGRAKHSSIQGGLIPDPHMMETCHTKLSGFSKNMNRMTMKEFGLTGYHWEF